MMYTSEEPVIYGIGYNTAGKVWERQAYGIRNTWGYIPQTMHARADRHVAITRDQTADRT